MAVATVAAEERRLIRCPRCGYILAAEAAGLQIIKAHGREWTGYVVSIRCSCGALWRIDRPPVPPSLPI